MKCTPIGEPVDVQQGTLVTGIMAVIGGIVWLVRLEGRVNTAEKLHADLKEDVTYIRSRIDRALNGR